MSNLFEHCRTAAKFAALRSNGEQKTVKVFASLQIECRSQTCLDYAEVQPNLRKYVAFTNYGTREDRDYSD